MSQLDEILRLRVPGALIDALSKRANEKMLTLSAYARLVLAQHVGMVEPPNFLVDTPTEYNTEGADNA